MSGGYWLFRYEDIKLQTNDRTQDDYLTAYYDVVDVEEIEGWSRS